MKSFGNNLSQGLKNTFAFANNPHEISYKRDENKAIFMDAIEMLRSTSVKCFKNKYKKGCIDCLNLTIRSTLAIPDLPLLKHTLKLLGFLYIFFNKIKYAVATFERLRDVAEEDGDFGGVMFAYK